MKRTLTTMAVSALAAGMALAQGQAPANHSHLRFPAPQKLAEALDLNDAQKVQAKEIFSHAREASRPLRAEMKQDRQALTAAVQANDAARIDKLSTAEGRLFGKLMAVRSEARAKFYQMLTPAQRSKAEQMRQTRQEHRRERG